VIQASGVAVSAGLVNAVVKALKGKKVSDLFGSVGVSTGSSQSKAPVQTAAKTEDKKAPKQ